MSVAQRSRFEFATAAAVAWVTFPAAWGLSTLLGDDGGGDSLSFLGVLGWVALGSAGLLMLLAIRGFEPPPSRRGLFQIGSAIHALGVVAAFIVFWAVPLWAAIYAIAMALFALSMRSVRSAAIVTAGGMVAGIVSLTVLTALEVGTPDPQYGDYPIAWTTAYTVAALGGALGSIMLRRVGRPAERLAARI